MASTFEFVLPHGDSLAKLELLNENRICEVRFKKKAPVSTWKNRIAEFQIYQHLQ